MAFAMHSPGIGAGFRIACHFSAQGDDTWRNISQFEEILHWQAEPNRSSSRKTIRKPRENHPFDGTRPSVRRELAFTWGHYSSS